MRKAIVDAEDERFYGHQGIDAIGVVRAIPYDLLHLSFREGASTITQQLAKLTFLHGNDHSPWRKLRAAALALRIERRYSKTQILDAYLATAYFGDGAHGITAAARHYFGVDPRRLNLAQASLLAGLVQAPSSYDPYIRPGLARLRQASVLTAMVRNHDASLATARETIAAPLLLQRGARLAPLARSAVRPAARRSTLALVLAAAALASAVAAVILARRFRQSRIWRFSAMLIGLGALAVFARTLEIS